MADDVTTREFSPIERRALDHVWIHSARWLDLAERDGLRVMVRGEGCRLFDAQGRSISTGSPAWAGGHPGMTLDGHSGARLSREPGTYEHDPRKEIFADGR